MVKSGSTPVRALKSPVKIMSTSYNAISLLSKCHIPSLEDRGCRCSVDKT